MSSDTPIANKPFSECLETRRRFESQTRWDVYFMTIAKTIASQSKCLSRQIGVIVVRDKSILSTGFNGPPRGVPHCNERHRHDAELFKHYQSTKESGFVDPFTMTDVCPRSRLGFRSGEALNLCPAGHAEVNAIANAARVGIMLLGSTMYLTCGIPCSKCLPILINAGVGELVCSSLDYYDELSKFLVKESELEIRTVEAKE